MHRLLLPLLLLSCNDKAVDSDGDDHDDETDADTDADADTDTDADADTDADVLFTGTLDFTLARDGSTECDATIALTGTEYTGPCEGCAFGYEIEAEITDESQNCNYPTALTWFIADSGFALMAFAPSYMATSFTGVESKFSDVFLSAYMGGGSIDWFAVADSGGLTGGTFNQSGSDIDWTYDLTWIYGSGDFHVYDDSCGVPRTSATTTSFGGAEVGSSTLDCEGLIMDVWTFETAADNTEVTVSVDTVAKDTAFDPAFWVNMPKGCTDVIADDNFVCAFAPLAFSCPSAGVISDVGTHAIAVRSQGSCTGVGAAYEIHVGGATNLTLAEDDVSAFENASKLEISVTGSGSMIAE